MAQKLYSVAAQACPYRAPSLDLDRKQMVNRPVHYHGTSPKVLAAPPPTEILQQTHWLDFCTPTYL